MSLHDMLTVSLPTGLKHTLIEQVPYFPMIVQLLPLELSP